MEIINKADNKFFTGESADKATAEIIYTSKGTDTLVIERTYVSEALRGQGIGLQLVRKVAELARQENKKVIPVCSYAKKVMTDNQEYKDILAEK